MNDRIMLQGVRAEAERAIANASGGSVAAMMIEAETVLLLVDMAERGIDENRGLGRVGNEVW